MSVVDVSACNDGDISAAAALAGSRVNSVLCRSLAEQITQEGFGIVAGFFPTPLIAEAARFARDAVKANNGEYIAFGSGDDLPGFLLGQMGNTPWFHELCQGVYFEMVGKTPPPPRFYKVFRCLSGGTGRSNSYYFHYDSYMLTILVPIVIPGEPENGRLILLPNARRDRRSYVVNVCEKIILDHKWAQRLIRRRTSTNPRAMRIVLEPGNLYAFCGYRSLHANEPCDEHDLRTTLLFHYANPHDDSALKRAFRHRIKARLSPSGVDGVKLAT